jgi:hypothetical protein
MFGDRGDASFVQDQIYTSKLKDQQQRRKDDFELQQFHAMQMKTLDAPAISQRDKATSQDITPKAKAVQPKFVLKKRASGEKAKKTAKRAKNTKKGKTGTGSVSAPVPEMKAPSALEGLVSGLVGYGSSSSSDDDI